MPNLIIFESLVYACTISVLRISYSKEPIPALLGKIHVKTIAIYEISVRINNFRITTTPLLKAFLVDFSSLN